MTHPIGKRYRMPSGESLIQRPTSDAAKPRHQQEQAAPRSEQGSDCMAANDAEAGTFFEGYLE